MGVTARAQAPPIAGVLQQGAGLKAQRKAPSFPRVDRTTVQGRGAPEGLLALYRKVRAARWQEWGRAWGRTWGRGIAQTTSNLTSFRLLPASPSTSPIPFPESPHSAQLLGTSQPRSWSSAFACSASLTITAPEAQAAGNLGKSLPRRAAGRPSSGLFLEALHTDPAPSRSFLFPLWNFHLQFFPAPLFICCCYPLPLLPTPFLTLVTLPCIFRLWGLLCYSWIQRLCLAPGCDHTPCSPSLQLCCSHPTSLTG